jgi:hypothetical protein
VIDLFLFREELDAREPGMYEVYKRLFLSESDFPLSIREEHELEAREPEYAFVFAIIHGMISLTCFNTQI